MIPFLCVGGVRGGCMRVYVLVCVCPSVCVNVHVVCGERICVQVHV